MNMRRWLSLMFMAISLSAFAKPNILLIVTDDQGYGDLSCHGNEMLETPNLDRLARQSVRLDNFHVAPCCAPTRAELLTGRNHHEAGVWGVHWARDYINLDETTIADVLLGAGYDTGMIGKWHSGRAEAWLPWNRGFNDAWVSQLYNHHNTLVSHNGKKMQTTGYADVALTDIAIDFIQKERAEQPWFLHMAYMSPHAPWVAPPEFVEKYKQKGCSDLLALLYGMIDHLDVQIGRLLECLDAENTVVIFMSDNGPINQSEVSGKLSDADAATRNPAGMRGVKGNIWENATRVPCFIRWPGQAAPVRIDALADVTDIFPTLLEIADVDFPTSGTLHGQSLMPLLKGKTSWEKPRELYKPYWRPFWNDGWSNDGSLDRDAVEIGNQILAYYSEPYKLVLYRDHKPELYNLTEDPAEKVNVIAQHPELSQNMERKLRAAYDDMLATGRCWQQPRFHIGHPEYDRYDTVGEVLAGSIIPFCSSVKDEGNVVCKSHDSVGWRTAGDAQTLRVDVVTSGRYKVYIEAKHFVKGTKISLQVGESALETDLPNEKGEIPVGSIDLKKGPQDLRFSILSAPARNNDVIQQLKTVRFERGE